MKQPDLKRSVMLTPKRLILISWLLAAHGMKMDVDLYAIFLHDTTRHHASLAIIFYDITLEIEE